MKYNGVNLDPIFSATMNWDLNSLGEYQSIQVTQVQTINLEANFFFTRELQIKDSTVFAYILQTTNSMTTLD